MRLLTGLAAIGVCAFLSGCGFTSDPGPTLTESKDVEAGNVEAIRAEIKMGAGELRLEGGSAKLLEASFRYSENLGRPEVRYESTGFRGQLSIESPKKGASGNVVNEWTLKMGPKVPVDLVLHLGAGDSRLDLSTFPLKTVDVSIGAGRIELNLDGKYTRDVEVSVKGGVGQAIIKLPKGVGVKANAKGGIGSVKTNGLTQRGDTYYNEAYAEGKPSIHLDVKGGVGEIDLRVVE
ncbi:MAG: hypothetical protein HY820_14040 [Acidobacteria bacterium]|nr:hypothetical protein [Acidobacteriota bacterium]